MAEGNEHYDASFKQRVLLEYRPGRRGPGPKALAKRFKVKDEKSIREWLAVWDGSVESLGRKEGSGRKRKLTHEEEETHIKKFVVERNREGKAVGYKDVVAEVQEQTGKDISLRTIQCIGAAKYNLSEKLTTRKYTI